MTLLSTQSAKRGIVLDEEIHLEEIPGDEHPKTVALRPPPQNSREELLAENSALRQRNAILLSQLEGRHNPEETLKKIEVTSDRVGKYIVAVESHNKNLMQQLELLKVELAQKNRQIEVLSEMVHMALPKILGELMTNLIDELNRAVPDWKELFRAATMEDGSLDLKYIINELEKRRPEESGDEWIMMGEPLIEEIDENKAGSSSGSNSGIVAVYNGDTVKIKGLPSNLDTIIERLRVLHDRCGDMPQFSSMKASGFIDENGNFIPSPETREKIWEYVKTLSSGAYTVGKVIYYTSSIIISFSPVIGVTAGIIGLFVEFPWLLTLFF